MKKSKFSIICKSCLSGKFKKYHHRLKKFEMTKESQAIGDREMRKEYALRRMYGLSKSNLIDLYDNQRGGCKTCGKLLTLAIGKIEKRTAFVDHDHITGDVRGLLCKNCNSIIGLAHESPEIMKSIIHYLKSPKIINKEKLAKNRKV